MQYMKHLSGGVRKIVIGVTGLFLILLGHTSFGQTGNINDIPTLGGMLPNNFNINKVVSEKNVTGSFYLNQEWTETDVYLVMDSMVLKGIQTRIDLRNNLLEVKLKEEIKVLPSFRIKSFFYPKSKTVFLTKNALKVEQNGFYKVIVDGDKSLFCRYDTKILRSNYNVQMAVGDKEDKIIKDKIYFLFSNNNLIKLNKTRRKLEKQFKSKPVAQDYINTHKTNPKDEYSLIQFVDYLNTNKVQL